MLDQMKQGSTLLFRQELPSGNIGIPRVTANMVGEVSNGKSQPIALDQSFHTALAACGI
ncbi:hypothetical protein [Pseudophaeobacter sp. EL27]|uniref:hypothetical protein n=1 Tax=Pseudophaeobacter sp. EL27 TaxID=2107580 RepID=UPI0013C41B2B|nr:hypothetical protein [Pseudophaeobacter sp. EL27]